MASVAVTPRPAAVAAPQPALAASSQTAPAVPSNASDQLIAPVAAPLSGEVDAESRAEPAPPAAPAPVRDAAARADERRSNAAPSNGSTNAPTVSGNDNLARSASAVAAPTGPAPASTPSATAQNETVPPILPADPAPQDPQVDVAASQQLLDAQNAATTSSSRDISPSQLSRATVETTAHLAAQILKKLEGRSTRFDMALSPEGLGRVDVSLEIDSDGRLAARLAFDNPAAATDMRARADELRRQLQDAGFQLTQDSLEFSERNPSSGFGGGGAFERAPDRRAFAGAARLAAEADAALPSPGAWASLSMTPDRVDMKV